MQVSRTTHPANPTSPRAAIGRLFEPTTVAGLALPSSFVMAPMTRARSPQGVPTAEVAAYYRRRAENGVGLIITEGTLIGHPSAGHEDAVPRMTAGPAEAGWRDVVDQVHQAGGRIAAQLWHVGSRRDDLDGTPAWSPSGVHEPGRLDGRAMSLRDVDTIIAAFAASARVAYRVGFDAVEIHGAHGYLVDEFLWSATNRRTDAYGETPGHRARFAAEIVAATRAATAPGYPIIFRFSQFKERDFTARLAETPGALLEVLEPIVGAGASILHASTRRFWEPEFPGSDLNLAGWAKRLTGLPTITVGSVGLTSDVVTAAPSQRDSLAALANRHADGEFDLVALGRALLSNPDWVTLAGQGCAGALVDYRKAHEAQLN
ncbi:oxidoreductase [Pengzhenrongella sicca]|uniref:12-oxophytodienoate reductase n=1 Tax=Pengzhenrongella sicca TaxID=2819238 RepID=A0A8A4ZDA2_9MICO|nr:12-oxophytodienoate reductase [Pengzhenrongella sicca]QTE28526.1 12-oxophytodienoate reductase [Pengzhenrongella sicca]